MVMRLSILGYIQMHSQIASVTYATVYDLNKNIFVFILRVALILGIIFIIVLSTYLNKKENRSLKGSVLE